MANRTYICVDCRIAKRAEAAGGLATPLRCHACGSPLIELSATRETPKKTDDKAWQHLKEVVPAEHAFRKYRTEKRMTKIGADRLTEIDWQIGIISAQEPSERRDQGLAKLAQEREQALKDESKR
jgi:hypothetical protein